MIAVAPPAVCHYFDDMTTEMEDAARRALELAPTSMRALAREAGVDPSLLVRIRAGERSAMPQVVAALVCALDRLAGRHAQAADVLREALSTEEE